MATISSSVGGSRHHGQLCPEEENDELREENRRLHQELAHAIRQAHDTRVLEELVGLRQRTPADTMGARVIAASMNPYLRVDRIRLDRGKGEVETGMPVINQEGLVGCIGRVYGDYADVLLSSDPQSSIGVQVLRTGSHGSLRGLGRTDSYACDIEMLERGKEPVQVGDLIVTSGLGDFPEGIPVGHVEKVTTKDYAMFQGVEVKPVVAFSKLRNVSVLLARPPQPDPDAGKRHKSERAYGVEPY